MKKIVLILVLAVFLAGAGILGSKFSGDIGEQAAGSVKKAVVDSAIQCCAIEGFYPPDIKYLEDNYGLLIDHGKYIVTYDMFASNILPDITIITK